MAADGVRSPVRQQLGIDMVGHGTFSDSITIYFRADLWRIASAWLRGLRDYIARLAPPPQDRIDVQP